MIRLKKVTDYGIVILTLFARDPKRQWHNASDIAKETHLPLPIVSKILKLLTHGALLNSQRGVKGGYSLAKDPENINVIEIVQVLEGPLGITQCTEKVKSECMIEEQCPVRTNWERINNVVFNALEEISLAELAKPSHQFRLHQTIPHIQERQREIKKLERSQ